MEQLRDWREEIEILFTEDEIQAKVVELGTQITADYKGRELIIVGILKGCVPFIADLMRKIKLPRVYCDYIEVSSYGDETRSSGVVRITKDLKQPIVGKNILVVEDIIDTGLTLDFLLDNLWTRHPHRIEVCVLLDKIPSRKVNVPISYRGFTIDNVFVVGYGLDCEGLHRNLPYIGFVKPPVQ